MQESASHPFGGSLADADKASSLEEFLTPPSGSDPMFIDGDSVVDSGEFTALVLQLADVLDDANLPVGGRVLILARKSIRSVALLYACLRTGVIFVPVDAESPPGRLALILDDCAPALVAVDSASLEKFGPVLSGRRIASLEPLPDCLLDRPLRAGDLFARPLDGSAAAYIMYTSGSTGTPKGVCVSRDALLSFLSSACRAVGYGPDTVFLSFFPLHFDPVLMEIFTPWGVGGRTVLFDGMQLINDLVRVLRTHNVTDFSCTPNVVSMLTGRFSTFARAPIRSLRSIWCGGESPVPEDMRRFRQMAPGVRLFNGYGPTECVVACSLYELPPGSGRLESVPIGMPFPGVVFLVVDEDGNELRGEHVEGELLIAGRQLMLGYWGRPDGVRGPFEERSGRTYYRTGDLVERRNGVYYFRGRLNGMVKIRGFRVHCAEVEAALNAIPWVSAACVVYDEQKGILICVAEVTDESLGEAIPKRLADKVPPYMIPERIECVHRLPRRSSGKLDLASIKAWALAGTGP